MHVSEPTTPQIAVSEELFAHLPSGLDLCYQTFGDSANPPIVLVMGLGGPMGWGSEKFCTDLAARGFFVTRFDNRDTGRSTKLRHHRVTRSDMYKATAKRGTPPYTLQDMADDVVGLLDHLGLDTAHIVGISMGGMIAQTMAISRPERVASMTSISSTTGKVRVGWPKPGVVKAMLARSGTTRADYVELALNLERLIGSPAFPGDVNVSRRRAMETYDRGRIASGVMRHLLAVLSQEDRTEALHAVVAPTAVIHGSVDPLVHKSGGRATAEAIPDSTYLQIAGMGHDLPVQLDRILIDTIVNNTLRAAD
ncbi:MAG: alpha/beta hydrolase [Actinomycetales bacterium]|nr:alpha/beta hydrolase [Actinomycetales bacterium]